MEIFINNAKTDVDPETEKYIRELEAANDSLQEENDSLRDELQQAAEVKADDALAEMKRMLIEELEETPAERLKEWIVDIVSEALIAPKCPKKQNAKTINYESRFDKFCSIKFPNSNQALDFYDSIVRMTQIYRDISLMDINYLLVSKYPGAEFGDGSKPSKNNVDYTYDSYGWVCPGTPYDIVLCCPPNTVCFKRKPKCIKARHEVHVV